MNRLGPPPRMLDERRLHRKIGRDVFSACTDCGRDLENACFDAIPTEVVEASERALGRGANP